MAKDHERALAEELYLNLPNLTQKEIAMRVGVMEETIRQWINKGGWEERRTANNVSQARIQRLAYRIAEKYLMQLDKKLDANEDLNNGDIDAVNKLAGALEKISGHESLRGYIVHITKLAEWLKGKDLTLAQKLLPFIDEFFHAKSQELKK